MFSEILAKLDNLHRQSTHHEPPSGLSSPSSSNKPPPCSLPYPHKLPSSPLRSSISTPTPETQPSSSTLSPPLKQSSPIYTQQTQPPKQSSLQLHISPHILTQTPQIISQIPQSLHQHSVSPHDPPLQGVFTIRINHYSPTLITRPAIFYSNLPPPLMMNPLLASPASMACERANGGPELKVFVIGVGPIGLVSTLPPFRHPSSPLKVFGDGNTKGFICNKIFGVSLNYLWVFLLLQIGLNKFARVDIGVIDMKLILVSVDLKVFAKMIVRDANKFPFRCATSGLILKLFEILKFEINDHVKSINIVDTWMSACIGLNYIKCATKVLIYMVFTALARGDKKEVKHLLSIFSFNGLDGGVLMLLFTRLFGPMVVTVFKSPISKAIIHAFSIGYFEVVKTMLSKENGNVTLMHKKGRSQIATIMLQSNETEMKNLENSKARTWDEGTSSNFATTPIKDIFKEKLVVICGLPGAFTGVCSIKYVLNYKVNIDKFKAKGNFSVLRVSVNNHYVVNGWAEKLKAKETMEFYGDFDGSFHKSLDFSLDLSSAMVGPHSHRWYDLRCFVGLKSMLHGNSWHVMPSWVGDAKNDSIFCAPSLDKFAQLEIIDEVAILIVVKEWLKLPWPPPWMMHCKRPRRNFLAWMGTTEMIIHRTLRARFFEAECNVMVMNVGK